MLAEKFSTEPEEGIRAALVPVSVHLPDKAEEEIPEIVRKRHTGVDVHRKHEFLPFKRILVAMAQSNRGHCGEVEKKFRFYHPIVAISE